ncbi:MAG TPA: PAAR domain-containing protein [Polyangiaceae bacterium]|nr:PAAR domain-containing protein [Polyangiaceae bacterium]
MQAGRVGDEAKCPEDGHSCSVCKHVTVGPSTKGSPDVFINNQPVLRVGDPGEHSETCCGDNKWRAKTGSSTVTANGLPLHRVGDETEHCGGDGKLITGSSDVAVGSGGNGARSESPKGSVKLEVTDAWGRVLKGVTARVLSPDGVKEVKFDGSTSLSGLHRGTTILVEKALQQSEADAGAVKGIVPAGTRMITPRKKPAQSSAKK